MATPALPHPAGPDGARGARSRLALDLGAAAWSVVSTGLGLGLALAVLPDAGLTSLWALPVAAVVVGLGDAALRPLLRVVAGRVGAVGALLGGLAAQLLVLGLALRYVPGIETSGWGSAVAVLVVAGLFMALGRWLVGAGDPDYVVGSLRRRARSRARAAARARGGAPGGAGAAGVTGAAGGPGEAAPARGMLVVQLDGVARPTLDHAVQAGLAPHLGALLATGSHRLETWWARVPSTTPASQAGLLHGTSDHVPAFRWWDRSLGRLVVTNRPDDATLVEERSSDGDGLLAHDGVAVATMFSGDAPTSLLVMSRVRRGLGPGPLFVHFFASPFVLVRAVLGTVGEALKELYQGWQQAARGVWPRVSRRGAYPVLRAVSNVMLRDLVTSVVAEQLLRGAPTVFVDLVDYDEIAHHAGPLRPESLRALEGLDRVVGLWQQVAQDAPRPYDLVVLSDHGQSLGATFEQVVGRSFLAHVRLLMGLPEEEPAAPRRSRTGARAPSRGVDAAGDDPEVWGGVNAALNAALPTGEDRAGRVVVGPDREDDRPGPLPEVAVVGSGNLGLVWFPHLPAPPTAAQVEARWPGLVAGLAACPAVGVVVVRDDDGGLLAVGPSGRRRLGTGTGTGTGVVEGEAEGDDPLAPFGPRAAADVVRAMALENAGDLLLVSSVDETGLVHAFEGLVGSHGGLGGAQNEAFLLHPAGLVVPDAAREDVGGERLLVGAESVHRLLVRWGAQTGARPAATS